MIKTYLKPIEEAPERKLIELYDEGGPIGVGARIASVWFLVARNQTLTVAMIRPTQWGERLTFTGGEEYDVKR